MYTLTKDRGLTKVRKKGVQMSYTKFGEYLRILRIKEHEVLGDMAGKLGTSVSFLSAVENGKKNIPSNWFGQIASIYNLTETEQNDLHEAIEESKMQYKISMEGAGNTQRKAAMQFARSFDNMDDETAQKIIELLDKQGKGGTNNGL